MYLEEFQKDLERALIELNMYGILAQLVEHLTFNQVVRGSNPRCLIEICRLYCEGDIFLPDLQEANTDIV